MVITSFTFSSFLILPPSLLPPSLYSERGSQGCVKGELGQKPEVLAGEATASHHKYTLSHLVLIPHNFSYCSKPLAFCLCAYFHTIISLTVKYTIVLIFLIYKIISEISSVSTIFFILYFKIFSFISIIEFRHFLKSFLVIILGIIRICVVLFH